MHQTGPMYRPPSEADTALLQVTVGCSHNDCAFCTMYRATQFAAAPENEIIEDLMEISRETPDASRIYLLNGDLSSSPLKSLCIYPNLSINICRKSKLSPAIVP